MEGWQEMASNGYTELEDGPESSWFGHYSLSQKLKKQGGAITPDFETYIQSNKPVWFTDADVSMKGLRMEKWDELGHSRLLTS